jgi:hypothetical protein
MTIFLLKIAVAVTPLILLIITVVAYTTVSTWHSHHYLSWYRTHARSSAFSPSDAQLRRIS